LVAVRVQAHKLPSLYSLQRRGDQFVTGPCTQDSDCQQGCCGFTSGKCAGPAVAQTNGSGGCGFGTKTPNCNVAAALGLSDCIAGAKNGDLADPGVQAAAAFAAKLDNLPFTPATASTAAPPAAAGPAFDPAGAPHVGNGAGAQFIGGQCLSAADCGSGCCAGPSGICSGPGAATQAGKTGCGFVAPK
ncbi:hypothetical protein B0H16DRAFT_1295696, partial [Mycena metata]